MIIATYSILVYLQEMHKGLVLIEPDASALFWFLTASLFRTINKRGFKYVGFY